MLCCTIIESMFTETVFVGLRDLLKAFHHSLGQVIPQEFVENQPCLRWLRLRRIRVVVDRLTCCTPLSRSVESIDDENAVIATVDSTLLSVFQGFESNKS